MPDQQNFNVRNRSHVQIDIFRRSAGYVFPSTPRTHRPLRQDYEAHAASLLDQLATALGDVPTPDTDGRVRIEGLKLGTNVAVSTLQPGERERIAARKLPTTFDFAAQDIVVLHSERNGDRTETALLFIPDDARAFLRERLTQYGRPLGNGPRPDLDRFEVVEKIEAAPATTLFVGPINFASAAQVWWEIWIRNGDGRADRLAAAARVAELDVHEDRLHFPDTTVLFVHGAAARLLGFAERVPGAISEIRRATDTIIPFLDLGGRIAQHDWVESFADRIISPDEEAPVVCTLDTGIAGGHPLLAPALAAASAYDAAWGTDDHHQDGHGTGMAGLVLYGDLNAHMAGTAQFELTHWVQSMKLLPPMGFPRTRPPAYGVVTQGAVALAEADLPNRDRAFCLATSARDFPPERPSSWSGALDQIAAGSMPGDALADNPATEKPKRLVVVATGNVWEGDYVDDDQCEPIEDPSQSWNSLSIGGITRKEQPPTPPPVLMPVTPANHRSPFSRGSRSLPGDLVPIKPEVLFEAGNMVRDEAGRCEWHPAVSLLTTGKNVVAEPLAPFWATSAAVAVAGNFLGQLQAALPGWWSETLRALTIDAASWPQPIRARLIGRGAHWKAGTKKEKQAILREVGYGVPDIERAIASARNDVTMIAQAEIQPFAIGADRRSGVFNEIHFYDLPWPRAALEEIENGIVTMKVTLSYFIEPNLTGRAATRPDTYRSFGLRFEMKKRSETGAQFIARLSAAQAAGGETAGRDTSYWLLGTKAMQAGSLHCDLWRGRAIDLALHDQIAVFPVGGWWKSHRGQRRIEDKARYALTISISAPDHAVDLHSEIAAQVDVRAAEIAQAVDVGVRRRR